MTLCYLGLGSNLAMPQRQLKRALSALRTLPYSTITAQSRVYISKPLGVRAQPSYYNMVVAIQTSLPAKSLLNYCQSIETRQKRLRKTHWGARTLDIDILLYGEKSIHVHDLKIPHPYMTERDFVLIPLLEIAPLACLPDGQPIRAYLPACKTHVIQIHH